MLKHSVWLMLLLSACSQQQMYQAVQENRLNACEKRVGEQRQRCIEQHNMPYDEYQREREALRAEE